LQIHLSRPACWRTAVTPPRFRDPWFYQSPYALGCTRAAPATPIAMFVISWASCDPPIRFIAPRASLTYLIIAIINIDNVNTGAHEDIPVQAESIAAIEGLLRSCRAPGCFESRGPAEPHAADGVFAGSISGARLTHD